MRPYKEQYARVERFLQRISRPNSNREEHEDFLWAFFQNCWHLCDWVKNDTSIRKNKRDAILLAVEQSKPLAICQCIANRSKHYRLRWKQRRNVKVVGKISVGIEDGAGGGGSATISLEYVIKERKKEYRALEIAEYAVDDWRKILGQYRL